MLNPSTGTIRACPRCGTRVAHTCWHEPDDDVRSVDMPVAAALKLALASLDDAHTELDRRANVVEELGEMMVARVEELEAALFVRHRDQG